MSIAIVVESKGKRYLVTNSTLTTYEALFEYARHAASDCTLVSKGKLEGGKYSILSERDVTAQK